MDMIDASRLIGLIELKDRTARAMMSYYIAREADIDWLQQYTNETCDGWASEFIEKYKEEFSDEHIQVAVFKYLRSIYADQPHSGMRFSEALYKRLREFAYEQRVQNGLAKG